MNFVHLHLAINHSPLYATLFAFLLLLVGVLKRNRTVVTTGLVVAVLAAVCTGAAFFTGDQAADIIGQSAPIPGVDKSLIKEHELAADFCLASSCIAAVLAIVTLFVRRRWLEIVLVIVVAWSASVAMRTAYLGGRIHHPEVRTSGAGSPDHRAANR